MRPCFVLLSMLALSAASSDRDPLGSISSKLAEMLNLVPPTKPFITTTVPPHLADAKHGVKMGIIDPDCDNAVDNLWTDWDGSPVNYTCFTPKNPLPVAEDAAAVISCDTIATGYSPAHNCMRTRLTYDSPIPTHEGHRPLWPVYGEYLFVPPQRWLHSVEHGAVVMLYHPCADPNQVLALKKLVQSCLWKYVITPWNQLSKDKPLALVAWGCRLQMAAVDRAAVRYFIRSKAFQGPEGWLKKQGQYSLGLLERSEAPAGSTQDRVAC